MKALPLLITYDAKPSVVRALSRELGLDDSEIELAVSLLERRWPPLTRREWLPFLFGVSPKLIGAMGVHSNRYYRSFDIAKKAGGMRSIVTPRRFLKTIQRWMGANIFGHISVPGCVHGFAAGRNIFSNAAAHLSGKNLMVLDVADFFPSVSSSQVVEVLERHLPYGDQVVRQLAGLCTLGGALPQGAPTSPVLANAVFSVVDEELNALAAEWDCVYTRYADDLAFSGARRFSCSDLGAVKQIAERAGFRINREKSRIVGAGGRQVVAGIVVNESGKPPRKTRRRWRATFHRAEMHPHEFRDRLPQLRGIAAFVNQYDPVLAESYFSVIKEAGMRG